MVLLSVSKSVQVFYPLFIYVFLLEIQLSRREGWDPINQFNPATCLCLSQAKTWISNVICRGLFVCVFSEFSYDERWLFSFFIDIDEIDDLWYFILAGN